MKSVPEAVATGSRTQPAVAPTLGADRPARRSVTHLRLKILRVADRMPALKPQSSANNPSFVAAGRQLFLRLGRMTSPVWPNQRAVAGKFSTSAKPDRHSVLGDREPKAHLLKKPAFGILTFAAGRTRPGNQKATLNQPGFSPHILKGEHRSLWLS
jgi:hypothetical protein